MAKKVGVVQIDGSYLFEVSYAASLLGTIPQKVEQLIGAGTLDLIEHRDRRFVPENQVTALRRNPTLLKSELARHINPQIKRDSPRPTYWPRSVFSIATTSRFCRSQTIGTRRPKKADAVRV